MAEPYGTIAKYRNALAIKKHNAFIQAWASPMALDVATVFWATWKGIEDRLPVGEDIIESEKPRDSRDLKNRYSAIIRVEVQRHTPELQRVIEEHLYRVWLAGAVEQSRDLGCTGWFLSSLSKSSTPSESASVSEDPLLQEAPKVLNVKADKTGWVSLPNLRARSYAKKHAAEAVTQINDTTRKEIARIVSDGVKSGASYNDIAKAIKSKFEEFAVPSPQKHIPNRAVLVAVTELANAYCEGNAQVGDYLQSNGVKMMKAWQTLEDDRVSDGCKENEQAGWIPIDKEFPSGHMHPPRFPGCRCDFLQDILDEDLLGKPISSLYGKQYVGKRGGSSIKNDTSKTKLNLGDIADDISLKQYSEGDDLEILGSAEYMNITEKARKRYIKASENVQTYRDFEKYLKKMNLRLDTSTEKLKGEYADKTLPSSVKSQVDLIIAALEQYKECGGISRLRKIHIWDKDLTVQGQYVYNAIGENDPEAFEIFFHQGEMTPHQVMHEFAHAFVDSMKPEGYDCVSWSAKLNDVAGLSKDAKAYAGAAMDVYEAEKFADNFAYAFTATGKYRDETQSFYYSVMDVLKKMRSGHITETINAYNTYDIIEEAERDKRCTLKRLGKPHKNLEKRSDWDIIKLTICRKCRYFLGFLSDGKPSCKAFPDGIPDKFWDAKIDHTAPYPGDNNITFEP
nr:MAG TPA: minor capsid protein [Caudoviricetes sp.]